METLRTLSVVVADDSAVYRAAMARAVEACQGLELVETAEDGAQALDAIRRHRPDIALLDWQMPELDGIEVCTRLSELDPVPATLPVLISADMDPQVEAVARAAGARACLSKVVSREELCAALLGVAARV